MADLKAFMVTEPDEGHSVIVFAEQSVSARRLGANELNLDFRDVESCVRKPQFDQYAAAGEVPVEVLLADGWWFECGNCGRHVTSEFEGDQALHIHGRHAYCDIDCYASDAAATVARRQREQALVDLGNLRFYGATVVSAYQSDGGGTVLFRFPGGTAPARWDVGAAEITLMPADVPAWDAFTGRPSEVAA